ncbi:SDR family NAD(P)-dependent oxidoreductase [Hymenobacter oligotrophus]|uniref:SDR family NAD(P)-dependent oxidoreductase n=1 Tax=Hymenobacter oligotrophus TaxID=2319843 RepID=A0A3B7QYR7_9BACT|nr:oxidoreductase [Hymenobacter oligotrophus]AYA36994.1 SDR family NAD(P)-dependent oxidoreductase [Hymenobacter oligotrophus]
MTQHWSVAQVPAQPGRVAIVTGANSGVGYETALALAQKGAHVVLACRNPDKAAKAQARIQAAAPGAQTEILPLDLSRLQSVRDFAGAFGQRHARLDWLINNAGVMMPPHQVTDDGFENQLATNYLGHFALTGLLLPRLGSTPGSRVVTLSSLSYKWAEIDFADLHAGKGYSRRKAYGQSKRACLVFAYELQRRLVAAGLPTRSVAAHPGLAKTNLDQYFPALIRPLGSLFLQPASQGAWPVLYAALADNLGGGEFIGPAGFRQMRGYPTQVDSDASSQDPRVGRQLWQVSEELTQTRYLESAAN